MFVQYEIFKKETKQVPNSAFIDRALFNSGIYRVCIQVKARAYVNDALMPGVETNPIHQCDAKLVTARQGA